MSNNEQIKKRNDIIKVNEYSEEGQTNIYLSC